jgi:hypothetical protein
MCSCSLSPTSLNSASVNLPNIHQTTSDTVPTMLFKSSTIMTLLFAYTALAANIGLLDSCRAADAGKACRSCNFNEELLKDLCYKGICGKKSVGKRVSYASLNASTRTIKADLDFFPVFFRFLDSVFLTLAFHSSCCRVWHRRNMTTRLVVGVRSVDSFACSRKVQRRYLVFFCSHECWIFLFVRIGSHHPQSLHS